MRRLTAPLVAALAAALLLGACSPGDDREAGSPDGGDGPATLPEGPGLPEEGPPQPGRPLPTSPEARWKQAPVVPAFDPPTRAQLRRDVAASARAGMRAGVFAKVGDSNTDYAQNLYGLGCRPVRFGRHRDLRPVHRRYTQVRLGLPTHPGCRPSNSFSRNSAAALGGAWTDWQLTPFGEAMNGGGLGTAPRECPPHSSPLRCELNLLNPRYALIMIGSNDVMLDFDLGLPLARDLRRVVNTVRRHGSVPVLSTVPPAGPRDSVQREARDIERVNGLIHNLAAQMQVPLINLWRALTAPGVINQGLGLDFLHLGLFGGVNAPDYLANAANLTEPALRHGANIRHRVWLETLRRLDRVAQG